MTEKQLKDITEFACDYLTLEEIAEVMEIDEDEFLLAYEKKEAVFKAVRKGRLLTKAALNRSLITQAKNGSNPAQEKLLAIITKVSNNEV